MRLKEDYKDPIYEGSKTYRITQNADGSSGILDTTKYTQEGDRFAAKDINSTNAAINQINHVTPVTLTATGWTGDFAPYAQTVMIEGVKADDSPIVVSMLEDGASEEVQKAYSKAYELLLLELAQQLTAVSLSRYIRNRLPILQSDSRGCSQWEESGCLVEAVEQIWMLSLRKQRMY